MVLHYGAKYNDGSTQIYFCRDRSNSTPASSVQYRTGSCNAGLLVALVRYFAGLPSSRLQCKQLSLAYHSSPQVDQLRTGSFPCTRSGYLLLTFQFTLPAQYTQARVRVGKYPLLDSDILMQHKVQT
ncbi:hypothetical protein R1flu_008104 [Riccia fluitans]|uniref:Uncharacterized protein n=1 Tax=Riccia fluitans TaxID=41844 RepID=A0ABD1YBS0_9MARC